MKWKVLILGSASIFILLVAVYCYLRHHNNSIGINEMKLVVNGEDQLQLERSIGSNNGNLVDRLTIRNEGSKQISLLLYFGILENGKGGVVTIISTHDEKHPFEKGRGIIDTLAFAKSRTVPILTNEVLNLAPEAATKFDTQVVQDITAYHDSLEYQWISWQAE